MKGLHSIGKDPTEGERQTRERGRERIGIARSQEKRRDDIVSAIVVAVVVCVMVGRHGSFPSTISNIYRPLRMETP